jgi:multisubunit Na+/H+ antiporter MnhB subunit
MEILAGAILAIHAVSSAWFFMMSKNIPTLPEGEVSKVLLVDFHLHLTALAIVLIVLGIGAMRARRWAWALNLILSWYG